MVQNPSRDPPFHALIIAPPRTVVTPTGYAPGIPAILLNLTKMGISDGKLLKRVSTLPLFRVSPRGNRGFSPALAHGFIAGLEIVGPIAGDLIYLPEICVNTRGRTWLS